MRTDTTFSNQKLTNEEFAKKYWLDGQSPYQYHSANIEDGRDEREQFIFNNLRALREQIIFYINATKERQKNPQRRYAREQFVKDQDQLFWELSQKAIKRATALAATSAVMGLIGMILALLSYFEIIVCFLIYANIGNFIPCV